MKVWCKGCGAYYQRSHLDENGAHRVGPTFGPVGAALSKPGRHQGNWRVCPRCMRLYKGRFAGVRRWWCQHMRPDTG